MHNRTGVTIGIPLCNEERFLRKTLDSVLQNYEYVDEVILSDNASIDGSSDICREYVAKYPKFRYVRHESSIHVSDNFRYLLNSARTEYFMFLRAKNRIDEDFIRKSKVELEKNPQAVASLAKVYLYNDDAGYHQQICVDPDGMPVSSDDVAERFRLAWREKAYFVIYCLCRRIPLWEAYSRCEKEESGGDVVLAARLLLMGEWVSVPNACEYYYIRENCSYADLLERYRKVGFSIDEQHRFWYIPLELWKLCRLKAPQIFDDAMKREILSPDGILEYFGINIYDDGDMFRRTKGIFLEYIRKKSVGKEVVFFGTGNMAEGITERVKGRLDVSCFIDNDKKKQRKKFLGRPVYSPEYVCGSDRYVVCIVSKDFNVPMMRQMLAYGYKYMENLFCLAKEVPLDCL